MVAYGLLHLWACSPTNLALVSAYKGRKPRARIAQTRDYGSDVFWGPATRPLQLSCLPIADARELGDLAVYPGGPFFQEEGPVSQDGELAV